MAYDPLYTCDVCGNSHLHESCARDEPTSGSDAAEAGDAPDAQPILATPFAGPLAPPVDRKRLLRTVLVGVLLMLGCGVWLYIAWR